MNYDYDPDNEPPVTAAEVSMALGLIALLTVALLAIFQ